jgi:hypothetical protein
MIQTDSHIIEAPDDSGLCGDCATQLHGTSFAEESATLVSTYGRHSVQYTYFITKNSGGKLSIFCFAS